MNSLWEHLGELLESDSGTYEFFSIYNYSAAYGNYWTKKVDFFNNSYSWEVSFSAHSIAANRWLFIILVSCRVSIPFRFQIFVRLAAVFAKKGDRFIGSSLDGLIRNRFKN